MAELTLQQLIAAGRRAEAGGDTAAANRFRAAAKQKQTEAPAAQPQGSAVDTFADAGRGITAGAQGMIRKGEEWLWRGVSKFGDVELGADMLTNLNSRRAQTASELDYYQRRSPTAFKVGEVIGESAVLAPVGGVSGAAAKTGLNGASTLLRGRKVASGLATGATALAAEGAAVGAFATGGEGDVGKAALTGAVTDVALGGVGNVIGRKVGEVARRRSISHQRTASRAVGDATENASGLIDDAAEYGGFTLDTPTAVGTSRSLGDLENLRNTPEGSRILGDFEASRELDVTAKARSLADEFGPAPDDLTFSTAGNQLQGSLSAQRTADEKAYKALYQQFDEAVAAGDSSLDSSGLKSVMDELKATHTNSANSSVISSIEADFARRLNDGSKPLTVGGVEDLIQDVNSLYSPTMNNGQKTAIREYKAGLESYVDNLLQSTNGDDAIIQAARAARKARSEFSTNWASKDIIQRITDVEPSGEFAVDYYKSLRTLKAADLRTIRARTLTLPDGKNVMASLQQAPLMEAFAAATKTGNKARMQGNVPIFNERAFRTVIDKLPKETQVELWGEEFVDHLGKGIDAWAGRTINLKGGSTEAPSLLLMMAQQARFLSSGKSRNFGMAASGMLGGVRNAAGSGARESAAKAITTGTDLPKETYEAMVSDVLDTLESDFTGAGGQAFGDAIRTFFRVGTVNAAVESNQ